MNVRFSNDGITCISDGSIPPTAFAFEIYYEGLADYYVASFETNKIVVSSFPKFNFTVTTDDEYELTEEVTNIIFGMIKTDDWMEKAKMLSAILRLFTYNGYIGKTDNSDTKFLEMYGRNR